ncbi:ABC transporter substrate-binding protein [Janibacter melonis]|uniref:ABC transporter substrate-binding protein n=1 Tax=Janibacter melonis TaxID=262209 RepID=UPI00177D58E3
MVGALALSSCARDAGASAQGGDADTYKIGAILAETGPIAGAGKTFANGARIAVEQVNDGDLMGEGRAIELVEKEGSEDPAKSANVAAQLAADPSVIASACCILSTVAGAAKPIAAKQKMPLVLWGATDIDLADPPYVYRTVTMPQPANEKLAQEVVAAEDVKTVAYGVMTDNSGIVSQAEAFKKGFEAAGAQSSGQVGTLSTTTNFTSAASDLISKNSDAVVVVGTQSNAVGLIAALHDKGYKGQVVTGQTISGSGVFESQSDALEGVPFPVYFLASEAEGKAAEFATAYEEKYGEEPDDYAAQGYMSIYTIAMGIKEAGEDVTRESLSTALEGMSGLDDTIYGPVQFEGGQLEAKSAVTAVSYTAPDGVIAPWDPASN